MVGGEISDIRDFPFVVAILYKTHFICGGSIISLNWVITAAHCVCCKNPSISRRLHVRSGTSFHGFGGMVHAIAEVIVYPSYPFYAMYNITIDDVALLRIKGTFRFKHENRRPIPMFHEGEELENGTIGLIAGWGRTSNEDLRPAGVLMSTVLPILDSDWCDNKLRAMHGTFIEGRFCAGWLNLDMDACNGDSGGPFVVDDRLAGLTSYGSRNCGSQPGIYTRVSYYRKWISGIVKI